MPKRFYNVESQYWYAIADMPIEELLKCKNDRELHSHLLIKIGRGGAISDDVAMLWIDMLLDKLKSFDAANLAYAKLT